MGFIEAWMAKMYILQARVMCAARGLTSNSFFQDFISVASGEGMAVAAHETQLCAYHHPASHRALLTDPPLDPYTPGFLCVPERRP